MARAATIQARFIRSIPGCERRHARQACPAPRPFIKKSWFALQVRKNKYNHQKFLLDTFSDSAEMSRTDSFFMWQNCTVNGRISPDKIWTE